MLPPEEGHCYESQIKYFFDRTKLTCLPFEYSGILTLKVETLNLDLHF